MYCIASWLVLLLKHFFLLNTQHSIVHSSVPLRCYGTVYSTVKKEPNQQQFVVTFFYRMTRRSSRGGRQRLFTQQQELAIVEMVRANNAIHLHQLRHQILADRQVFFNILVILQYTCPLTCHFLNPIKKIFPLGDVEKSHVYDCQPHASSTGKKNEQKL